MASEQEIRLKVVKHIGEMLIEMADIDFDEISEKDEEILLSNFEEMASHILDSLGFEPISDNADGITFQANFKVVDPNKYIIDFLGE